MRESIVAALLCPVLMDDNTAAVVLILAVERVIIHQHRAQAFTPPIVQGLYKVVQPLDYFFS